MMNLEYMRKQAVAEYREDLLRRKERREAWENIKRTHIQSIKREMINKPK